MNAADLRSGYSPRELDLLAEALECVRGRRDAVTDCLKSDDAELQVLSFIDLAHAAFADRADDAETPQNEFTWLEAGAPVLEESVEIGDGGVVCSCVLLFSLEKLFKMLLQFRIVSTGCRNVCRTILRRLFQGVVE